MRLCVALIALRRPPQRHCSTAGVAHLAAHNKMASQSCQRGPESAHMEPKGLCCTALCCLSSPGSSLHGPSLGPPRKCGGLSKPVQSSCSEGSLAGLWRLLLLLQCCLPSAGRMQMEWEGRGRGCCSSCHPWWALMFPLTVGVSFTLPALSALAHRAEY